MFRATKTIGLGLVAVALAMTACGPDRGLSPVSPVSDVTALTESAGLVTSPSGVVFLADEWKSLEDKTPFLVPREKWEAEHTASNIKMAYSVTGQVGPRVLCHSFASVCNNIPALIPGATVVFWNDSQWLSATTASFKQFDVIYLHDSFGGLTQLAGIKNTWGAAITGRAVITGTHFEHCGGTTGGPCIAMRAALNWIHAGTGTGLLASTQISQNSANVMIPSIPPFNGITYLSNGGGFDLVHITEPGHLTMQGSTDATLSNFSNSSHSIFASIGSFTSVAEICTVDVFYPSPCPSNGKMVPYYLVTSVSVADQDGDGVPDASDNCPTVANANQADANGNGVGDACESAPSVTVSPKNPTVSAGTVVNFTTVAADADNPLSSLRYEWRVNGIIQSNTTSSFTYTANADATIRVTVRDPGELTGFDETKVTTRLVDNTPPVVTPVVTGTLGLAGWYTSDVNVSWNVSDPESAITSPACSTAAVTVDTSGDTFTCVATSTGGTTTESVTIKRDASKPTIVATQTGASSLNGWWSSDVTNSWTVTANGPSGVTHNCQAFTLTISPAFETLVCNAFSGAGLRTSKIVELKRDDAVPTVTPVVSGTLGDDNWFTSDVSIGWTVKANGPSGATSSCTVSTLSSNTPGQTYECIAISGAGKRGVGTVTVKRDDAAPEVVPNVSGTVGLDDWFTSNVQIGWSVNAGISGATSNCVVTTLSTNSPGQSYECSARSGAGITATGTTSVKRDATVPVVDSHLAGTLGLGGWYTSNVDVSWTVAPGGPSGISASCPVSTLSSDSNGTTYDCTATTGAGVSATEKVTVKRDASTPTVTAHVSGDLGTGGWYTSDVGISWTVDANGPSGAAVSCPAETLSSNTASRSYSCTGASGAGVSGSGSVTVKRDDSTPTVTPVVTGTSVNGWYNTNVGISWNVISNGPSMATSSCTPSTLSTDTQGQSYSCTATSGAGKEGSNSVTVKRDATKPTIGYAGNAGVYTVDQNVSISCSASDDLSGLASSTCAPISGSAYSFGVGTTTKSASALDIAGNSNSATTSFTVKATSASLCTLTRLFVTGPGEQGIENSLCGKLEKGNYAPYINEVQAQSGKAISASNANILITWAKTL
jgi:hypothetical protein